MDEEVRQRAGERNKSPDYFRHQGSRKKIEALFGELKNRICLRPARLRRLRHVREQFFLAATAKNLKRLVRFLATMPPQTHNIVIRSASRPFQLLEPCRIRKILSLSTLTFSTALFKWTLPYGSSRKWRETSDADLYFRSVQN